ncbi:MAG: hypothetical protein GX564_00305 [Oligosphaeraceae bacterium]|nr:hypothetical protein [Oligosphaeraceae bacterium]
MSEFLTILPAWQPRLAQAGLADLTALLAFAGGDCLSSHLRGKTSKLQLPDGQSIFIKQDYYTKSDSILRQLYKGQWPPQPNTEREHQGLELLLSCGITVPKVIAWGQRRRFGLPHQGVLVMLPLSGIALDKYLLAEPDATKRAAVIAAAEKTLRFLQDHRLDWNKDCKPEHFFLLEDGSIGLLDVERLRRRRFPLSTRHRQFQLQRFHALLPKITPSSSHA